MKGFHDKSKRLSFKQPEDLIKTVHKFCKISGRSLGLNDSDSIEDLAYKILITLYKNPLKYRSLLREKPRLFNWVYICVRNNIINQYNKKSIFYSPTEELPENGANCSLLNNVESNDYIEELTKHAENPKMRSALHYVAFGDNVRCACKKAGISTTAYYVQLEKLRAILNF